MKNLLNTTAFETSNESITEEQSSAYINDLTQEEDSPQYDWYNFFPDASF